MCTLGEKAQKNYIRNYSDPFYDGKDLGVKYLMKMDL